MNTFDRDDGFHRPRRLLSCRGNSLVEYGLPLGIIGILVVGCCLVINPAIKGFLQSSLSSQPIQNSGTGTSSTQTLSVQPLGMSPLTTEAVLTLSDGTQIRLSNFPKDIKQSIDSVGANGTTDIMANALAELAQKLKDAGKIDDLQFQSLIKLSQKGHETGRMQGLIDEAIERSKRDGTPFGDQLIQYDGKSISAVYFARLLGVNNGENIIKSQKLNIPGSEYIKNLVPEETSFIANTLRVSLKDSSIGSGLYDLVKTYQSTVNSGTLKDPVIKDIVWQLTRNIYDLTQNTATATNAYANNSLGRKVLNDTGDIINSPESFKNMVRDSLQSTHINSKSICTIGRGSDTGLQCQGY